MAPRHVCGTGVAMSAFCAGAPASRRRDSRPRRPSESDGVSGVPMTRTSVIDLPPLALRAAITSHEDAARVVDVVFSTGAAVERRDYFSGQPYLERLSLDRGHVNLDRLNNGAPVLDSHTV